MIRRTGTLGRREFCIPFSSYLALAITGCSMPHQFTLQHLGTLGTGRSTRAQVEEVLGAPSATGESIALYQSHSYEFFPPAPFSFVSWLIYLDTEQQLFQVLASYDEENRLAEASLTLSGSSAALLLLLLPFHGPVTFEGERYREPLRRIEENGIEVWYRYGEVLPHLERYSPDSAAE